MPRPRARLRSRLRSGPAAARAPARPAAPQCGRGPSSRRRPGRVCIGYLVSSRESACPEGESPGNVVASPMHAPLFWRRLANDRWAMAGLILVTGLVALAIAAAVRPSLPLVFVVIGIVGWAGMARLVRGQVLVVRALEYVQAARALGASDARIVARHLLPNVLAPVVVAATLGIGGAIMAEAALSFVGLGAQPPTPSWGAMVADGRDLLRVAPWVSLFPGLAVGLTVLGVNRLGDGLRDALDVRAR